MSTKKQQQKHEKRGFKKCGGIDSRDSPGCVYFAAYTLLKYTFVENDARSHALFHAPPFHCNPSTPLILHRRPHKRYPSMRVSLGMLKQKHVCR